MHSHKTSPQPHDDIRRRMNQIGLRAAASEVDDLLARAISSRWPPTTVLEELLRIEATHREQQSLERRLSAAKLSRFKPIADFDWNWPTKIDRAMIERALSGTLVAERENLILLAAHGLGKTMIAKNIVYQAILQGRSALYVEASRMLLDLGGRQSSQALDRRLKHYAKPDLLCIDEVGYLSYDARAADLLFEVVASRYERRSVIITTNLSFSDWPTMFPNATSVTALVDRLTHHADVLLIEGKSYRRREAEENRKTRNKEAGEEP